jgi:hypothetical protein
MLRAQWHMLLTATKQSSDNCLHCRVKKYGPVFRSSIFGSDVIVVTDFAALQKVGALHLAKPCSSIMSVQNAYTPTVPKLFTAA